MPDHDTRGHRVDVLAGGVSAMVVFVAVPGALWMAVGTPVFGPAGRLGSVAPGEIVDALNILGWTAWFSCCWPLSASVVRRVWARDAGPVEGARFSDRMAARIATAILVVLPLSVALSTGAGAATASRVTGLPPARGTASTPSFAQPQSPPSSTGVVALPVVGPAAAATGTAGTGTAGTGTAGTGTAGTATTGSSASTYVVQPGDSLWSIAQKLFGDAAEWQGIASLNLGRAMPDGTRFLDPALIRPGWALTLPPGATLEGVATLDPAGRASAIAASLSGATAAAVPPALITRAAASSTARPGVVAHVASGGASHEVPSRPDRPWGPTLPELATLGIGALGATALARRLRIRRQRPGRGAGAGASEPDNDGLDEFGDPDAVVDLATLFGHFERAPVLDWMDLANRHLAAGLASAPTGWAIPPVRLFRIGADGVDAWLREPTTWAPDPWELREGGRIWHLSSRHEPGALQAVPPDLGPLHPAIVPIGDDETGTWLAVVDAGSCLPVIGAGGDTLVATMRLTAESWPWSDQLSVTIDPGTAERLAALDTDTGEPVYDERVQVLFVGDPSLLSPYARGRCSTITTLPLPPTDLTIVVDARAVTIHPLGVTLRPHMLDRRRATVARQMFDQPPEPSRALAPALPAPTDVPPCGDTPAPAHGADIGSSSAADAAAEREGNAPPVRSPDARPPATAVGRTGGLGPGPVEVRLLVPVPRIDGLREQLPAKRVRRATELVAYLALHHPDPVTSDRLRTRVLGSPDADAAAKTLFNVATAARKALGFGPEAEPYLPAALKTGHYRISDLVTVDVTRAVRFVVAARNAPDAAEAIALYRAALDLVEGEPVSGILSGYAWWQSEGHAGRVRGLLVEAACGIARLASASGPGGLVEWALGQARAVDPYSEELTQAAMRWAAESGDADRLRREWAECRRMVDELDPGGVPSARTEALYAELTRRTSAGIDSRRERGAGGSQASLAAMEAAPRSTEPSAP